MWASGEGIDVCAGMYYGVQCGEAMRRQEHNEATCKRLGQDFDEVHRWLDEFHGHPRFATRHRKVRHHWAGIEQVRERWGDQAAEAAKFHILDDLRTGECELADESDIPKDEADYVHRGYW